MGLPQLKQDSKYTYADYLAWDDEHKWEIIDGELYDMSPSPFDEHQAISWELSWQIQNYLKGRECIGRAAPFDVRFADGVADDNKIINVVQPDIVVICDRAKIDRRGCIGAPDFIIEITSPSTAYKDHTIKLALYELNKVKEYWIVDPLNKIVTVYLLGKDGKYAKPAIHDSKVKLKVTTLSELKIDLNAVFAAPVF
ncbi:MAG TPA: Uma2 family endonuclease [Thermodesulfovibrionia bacterium]|nr:Uma2 family endonuclease [Thermodesulfovibrionia bacterium]